MRFVVPVALAMLISGCGMLGTGNLLWPAHIASVEGFDQQTTSEISGILGKLNQSLGQNAVQLDPSGSGSPITLRLVSNLSDPAIPSNQASTTSQVQVAARATLKNGSCLIEVAQFLIQDQSLLQPVLWHELGHCAGLLHTAIPTQIMSPKTVSWQNYDQNALETFFNNFIESAGLKR